MNSGKKFDYKWVIVGLSFMMVLVALGFCSSPKSLYIGPVSSALGIDRSAYSITDSCRYVATAVVNIFFGFLVGKFGAKKLILAGFGSLIISSLLYATATNVWVLYLAGVFLGIGLSWTATTMVGYVVTKWCKENKGTIMGAVLASNGIGGAVAIQIISPIVKSSAEGYRTAYFVVASILAAVFVILAIFFKDKPILENEGAAPEETKKKKSRGADWVGIEFGKVLRTPYLYMALVCIFFSGFILQGIWGITAAHLGDVGIDATTVSVVLSVHSLTIAISKFSTGFLYDKFGLRVTSTFCTVVAVISAVLMTFIDSSPFGIALAFIYGVICSFALPLETVMLPIYANDLFGAKSFDKVLGLFVSVNTAGYAVGAPVMNLCYDVLGSYVPALIVAAVIMAALVILLQVVITSAHNMRRAVEREESSVPVSEVGAVS